jgi:hypothetical protein
MKFKIGDHVRVISRTDRHFDRVGTVVDVYEGHAMPFIVTGLLDHPVAYAAEELILGEQEPKSDAVNHPPHYGGEDDPYEAIKVIEAWGLGFHLGNTVKYISRAGKKTGASLIQDLRKARWYIDRLIQKLEAGE